MVRFSDMLGGEGEPDDAPAATVARDLPPLLDDETPDPDPDAAPLDEPAAEPELASAPAPAEPSAQEVLDRLTQYATATRATAPPAEPETEPEPEPQPEPPAPAPAPEATTPTPEPAARPPAEDAGDDILPRGKRPLRSPRGKRRDA